MQSIYYTAEEKTREEIEITVQKLVELTRQMNNNESNSLEVEAAIADLVHTFLLPTVQRLSERRTIRQSQLPYLKAAHEACVSQIANLDKNIA
ncbi:unnamed protein product [Didymodactylos carnosus]|uniref:Uncharacterized protein n=1 Tax=Didymodactylos carnosus TaxID=1234261 RepID=A0A813TP40_9BILA|nr:unnamed protein product [Didymodactylos carnosus]CAF0822858.1 unnamed protein product [Didymodactylos carnosus]CAF3600440.1 unnamed protein product [Didymodactylos carnosus]CAF3607189.1 unnamed protein product [Didymodactylos carnosus]